MLTQINSSNTATRTWAARFLAHDTPVSLVVGQSTIVNLRIENIGLTKWLQNGTRSVHLGYQWFDHTGAPVHDVEVRRTGLPTDLYPRQDIALGAMLSAPKTPGVYTVQWDAAVEGIGWFASMASTPLRVPVTVTATPRDITGWRVEANANIAQVARALDGNPATFWDSGVPQARGQWFRLNLSSPRVIDGIQFLSPGKGFPVAYALHLSADGRTWIQVARVAADNAYDVMAIFAPQMTHYAQINLLGASSTSWQISEILVHAATTWTANASHNAQNAERAIDNRDDTAWHSGAPQTKEMWFAIDLGHPEIVSGITLDSPAEASAASYRIAAWNAVAHRWQVVAEKLNNTAPVDATFEAIQTQFISVQLLQASPREWIIQHAHVHREMERWLGPNT
jgi:hypothetical protein